mgnify:CR=1 FL=1
MRARPDQPDSLERHRRHAVSCAPTSWSRTAPQEVAPVMAEAAMALEASSVVVAAWAMEAVALGQEERSGRMVSAVVMWASPAEHTAAARAEAPLDLAKEAVKAVAVRTAAEAASRVR